MDIVSDSNAAFTSTPFDTDWIELFHSRPNWKITQISYRADDADWIPFNRFKMLPADDIKQGFRAFRIRAHKLEFRIADSTCSVIDSNNGRNYLVNSPGRYVLESGNACRRVSDAMIADCIRAERPNDRFVELSFRPYSTWRSCYLAFSPLHQDDNTEWCTLPMNRAATPSGSWLARVEAPLGIDCAFRNDTGQWDSNDSRNYIIRAPGSYTLGQGTLEYKGVSIADIHVSTSGLE